MKIEHDIHLHTHLSLCAQPEATVEEYVRYAKAQGIRTIGISDHFWDESVPGAWEWYQKQNYAHILESKEDIKRCEGDGVKILFGAECEYSYATHGVAITPEIASELDFLLVPNSHTHMTMPKNFYEDRRRHAEFMLNAYYDIIESDVSEYITAIAHPFDAVCCPYDNEECYREISDAEFRDCFKKTAEKGIGIEINTASFAKKDIALIEKSGYLRMVRLARECGCKFTFGTDSHHPNDTVHFIKAYAVCALADIRESDIKQIG